MRTITITAGGRSYDALVGAGLLADCGKLMAERLRGPACAVVGDEKTAALFAEEVLESLRGAGFAPTLITIPAGEGAKSLPQVGVVCEEMAAAGLDRTSFVVALGGGVVGDLAGFAAAIYHRGIPHVQIPTTLLAQVDSAIGGKTAVNTAQGKNLLGAVHQPALVLADVATLTTLPKREFNQGFAEIIKHAIIAEPALFAEVARVFTLRAANDVGWLRALEELVARNIALKAAIVARDEHDVSGARAVLNFGHTVGHAIERAGGYGRFLHGEAISLGIVAACEVSVRRAGLAEEERDRVIGALQAVGLPTKLPTDVAHDAILAALVSDKKFERGGVRFVVSPRLGEARLTTEVTLDDIRAVIACW
ncbi:MAG: 3-dehydroquinate synthase [Chthoniobacterales bacterium]